MAMVDTKSQTPPALGDEMSNTATPATTAPVEKIGFAADYTDQLSASEKNTDPLPDVNAPIEALGLEDWQALEKKLVRRLDMTLMPMLWVLYLFNYLDRASISYAEPQNLKA